MNTVEFGKDLGLMHEVVITGRKTGFEQGDWAKLAHSDKLMRAALNFVRQCETSNFPQTTNDTEKVERVAKLAKVVRPYTRKGHGCICCEQNKGYGKRNGMALLAAYEELGLVLPKEEKHYLETGNCHQPLEMLFPHIKEVLGVESPGTSDWGLFPLTEDGSFKLECLVTTVTSIPNIIALKEAFAAQGLELVVNIKFEKDKPKETQ